MTVYMIGIKNSCKSYTEIHSTAPADGVKRLQQPHLVKERCSTVSLIQVKVFYRLKTGLLTLAYDCIYSIFYFHESPKY